MHLKFIDDTVENLYSKKKVQFAICNLNLYKTKADVSKWLIEIISYHQEIAFGVADLSVLNPKSFCKTKLSHGFFYITSTGSIFNSNIKEENNKKLDFNIPFNSTINIEYDINHKKLSFLFKSKNTFKTIELSKVYSKNNTLSPIILLSSKGDSARVELSN